MSIHFTARAEAPRAAAALKAAQEALMRKQAQLEEAQRLACIGTWEWDLSTNQLSWSDEHFRIFGLEPQKGPVRAEFGLAFVHPDDRQRLDTALRDTILSGDGYEGVFRIRREDGSIRVLHSRGEAKRDASGSTARLYGTIADITERYKTEQKLRESEAQYHELADAVPQIVWVTDSAGNVEYLNRRFFEYGGLDPAVKWTVDELIQTMCHPDEWKMVLKSWNEAARTRSQYEREMQIRAADGTFRWFLVRGLSSRDAAGRITRWFGTCTDIHDQKIAAEVLLERAQHDALMSAVGRVLSGREPLEDELQQCCQCAVDHLGVPLARIWLLNPLDNGLQLTASAGLFKCPTEPERDLPADTFVIAEVRHSTEECPHGKVSDNLSANDREWMHRAGIRFCGSAPVICSGRLLGIMAVFTREPLTDTAHKILCRLCERIALGIERKRAEEALRASQELLTNVLAHIPHAVFWKDRDSVYLGCNENFARDAGLTNPEQIVGKTDYDLAWRTEEANHFRECDQKVAQTGVAQIDFEEQQQSAVHGPLTILTSKVPLRDATGSVIGVLGIYSDITERKRIELALRESERFARSTVDSLSAHIAVLDETGRIIAVNRAWEEFSCANGGASQKTGIGADYLAVCEDAAGDDLELARSFAIGLREVVASRRACFELEYPCHSPSQLRWFTGSVTPFYGEGPTRVVVRHSDITERYKAAEEMRLRLAALEAADDMILIADRDGRIEYVNPSFTCVTGYTADEAIGRTTALLNSGEHEPAFYRSLWQTVLAGHVWRGEIRNRRKDGTVYPEEMTIAPVLDAKGQVIRFVAIKRDVTDKLRTQKLLQEREGLESAIRGMERVLGVLGHELRTPLAGIRVMAETLLTDAQVQLADANHFLKAIDEEVIRMSGMVNDMLEMARVNSGAARWNWATFLLQDVIKEAMDLMERLIDSSAVDLSWNIIPQGVQMHGDAAAVRRLLLNLLSNARNFTQSGVIQLSAREVIIEGIGWVDLEVRDTGCGIALEIADKVGEAFALNAGVIGDKHVRGSGLGLAICRGIIAAHGGSMRIESKLGQGTTVVVRLRSDLSEALDSKHSIDIVRSVT